jgi:hypothetical protein
VLVFGYFLVDKRIEFGEFLVQGEDFPGECGDDQYRPNGVPKQPPV